MAKALKRSLKQTKAKKKRWYLILSPNSLGKKPIGETYLSEAGNAVGRTVKVNLMQISGDVKSQSSNISFEISEIKDNRLQTKIIGYSFSPASIKRFVRRRMTRIDDSVLIVTKDNKKVRIKPFLLTRGKVNRSVECSLRSNLRAELNNIVRKTSYEDLFSMVIKHHVQKELRSKLNKIYPIRNFEIRILKEETRDVKPQEITKEPQEKVEEEIVEKEEKKEEELESVTEEKEVKEEEPEAEKPKKEIKAEEKEEKPEKEQKEEKLEEVTEENKEIEVDKKEKAKESKKQVKTKSSQKE